MAQKKKKSLYDRLVHGKEEAIRAAARNNTIDEHMATLLECSPSSVKKLRKDYPDFCDLLKIDRRLADNIVEDALFRKAVGHDNEEVVTITRKSGKPGEEFKTIPLTATVGNIRLTQITFSLSKAKEKEIWNVLKQLDSTAKQTAVQRKIKQIARQIRRIDVTTAFSQIMAICKEHLRI